MPGYFRMRRDLAVPITPAPLGAGFALRPFDKLLIHECRELLKRVYAEGLGDNGISFEGFWTWLTTDPEFDPALVFIVTRGVAVVGFCHCWTAAFIKDLAVAPEHRQRGLGTTLLTLALEEFRRRGAAFVDLKTDIDNTKAQSLYRRLGFVVVAENA